MVNRGKVTNIIYFQGKGSFFQHLQQGDAEYKNWNVRLYMNTDSVAFFKKLQEQDGEVTGILNELKVDENGDAYHHFKRPFFKNFGKGDEPLLPPEILDKNNNPWDRNTLIGSGSDITVGCELYQFTSWRTKKKGKAIRLANVRVEHLIPYTRADFTDQQNNMVKGIDNVPVQT